MPMLREAADHWREWFDAGEFEDGLARVREALAASEGEAPSVERVRVLYGAHLLAFRLGEPSRDYAQQTLDSARKQGDTRGGCDGLTGRRRRRSRSAKRR